MAFEITHVLDIDAPVDVVWEVVTDLPRYGEWNPFQVSARSTLEPGDPIFMQVQIFDLFTQPQRETIFECKPPEVLAYGLAALPLGALRSHRAHELEANGVSCTRYRSHFELDGWLAPLTRGLLGERLEAGFEAASLALKERSETLAAERSG
jgi:hypothetical protein